MSDITQFYDRNHQFAVGFDQAELPMRPQFMTIVLTCIDARVDPAHFLDLKLGDAIVLRNAGGRVTEAIERELAILWAIATQMSNGESPKLSLAIIHHSDCGMEKLAKPEAQEALSRGSGIDLAVLQSLVIEDHNQSLIDDVDRLRGSSIVPRELVVSTHLYNVHNGRLSQVMAPTALHSSAKA